MNNNVKLDRGAPNVLGKDRIKTSYIYFIYLNNQFISRL